MTAPEDIWTDVDTALAWADDDTFRHAPAALTPMQHAPVTWDDEPDDEPDETGRTWVALLAWGGVPFVFWGAVAWAVAWVVAR